MQLVRNKTDVAFVSYEIIAKQIAHVIAQLERDYCEPYQASNFGWFAICDHVDDLFKPLADCGFSIDERLDAERFEFLESKPQWCEILILLNDIEGVLIYVPIDIWRSYQQEKILYLPRVSPTNLDN